MTYAVMRPDELRWLTRPHEDGEPARDVDAYRRQPVTRRPVTSNESDSPFVG